jgi:hypothetical protein
MLFNDAHVLRDVDYIMAVESMKYQPQSAFAKAMIKILDEAKQDYLDISTDFTVQNAISVMNKYWRDKYGPALASCIKDHTKLTVDKVKFGNPEIPTGNFMILSKLKVKGDGTNRYFNDISRLMLGVISKNDMHPNNLLHLQKIESLIDEKLGVAIDAEELNELFSIELYFEIPYLYFLQHLVHSSLRNPTSEEIAACFMHELGHFFAQYAATKRIALVAEAKQTLVRNFLQVAPPNEVLGFAKNFLKTCNNMEGVIKDDKFKTCNTILKGLIDLAENSKTFTGENNTGHWFTKCILLAVSDFYYPITALLLVAHQAYRVSLIVGVSVAEKLLYGPSDYTLDNKVRSKVNDLPASLRNQYEIERLADEFAITHGLGAALASGFELDRQLQALHPILYSKDYKGTGVLSKVIRQFYNLFEYQLRATYPSTYGHEYGIDRTKTILRDIIKQIKLTNEIPELELHATIQADMTQRIIDDYSKSMIHYHSKVGGAVMLFLKRVVDAATPMSSNKFNDELYKLMNDIGKMDNNLFYLLSSKFKHMV